MGFALNRDSENEVKLARQQVLFPSHFERCSIFTPSEAKLEYRTVKIRGRSYPALVDNQASLNIMSLEFVKDSGLTLRPNNTAFRLSDGSICHAVGCVLTPCIPVRASSMIRKSMARQEFYVLKTAFAPLVLGLPFIQDMKLLFWPDHEYPLDRYRPNSQLIEAGPANGTYYVTACLRVLLTSQQLRMEAIALPDIGANVNLMSQEYAKAAKFHVHESPESEVVVIIGDGQNVCVLGKVHTTIHLGLNMASSKGLPITFLVVNSLVADLILSRHFSKRNRLFESFQPRLTWVFFEANIPGFQTGGLKAKGASKKPLEKDTRSAERRKADEDFELDQEYSDTESEKSLDRSSDHRESLPLPAKALDSDVPMSQPLTQRLALPSSNFFSHGVGSSISSQQSVSTRPDVDSPNTTNGSVGSASAVRKPAHRRGLWGKTHSKTSKDSGKASQ